MTDRILYHEREMLLKLNSFQLMEQRHSRDSILMLIYRIGVHDLKNRNELERAMKNA